MTSGMYGLLRWDSLIHQLLVFPMRISISVYIRENDLLRAQESTVFCEIYDCRHGFEEKKRD